jgi:GNAT superfamily N-acetyltransferase
MPVEIRKYRASDFDACRKLWAQLTEHHRELYDDMTIGGDDPGRAIEPYLANQNLRGPWVAEVRGETVGLGGLIVHDEEAEVEPLVVASGFRCQGIGKSLLDHIIREARRFGVRFLSVRPVARNVGAVTWFVDAGFDLVGHIDLFQDLSVTSERKWKSRMILHGKRVRY